MALSYSKTNLFKNTKLDEVSFVTDPTGNEANVKLFVVIDASDDTLYGKALYYSGTAWVDSDGSNTQANTLANYNLNISSLPEVNSGYIVFVKDVTSGQFNINEASIKTITRHHIAVMPTFVEIDVVNWGMNTVPTVPIRATLDNYSGSVPICLNEIIPSSLATQAVTSSSNGKGYLRLYPNADILPVSTKWAIEVGGIVKRYTVPAEYKVNLTELT